MSSCLFVCFQSSHDFKTPLVEGLTASPQRDLPEIEGEEGSKLLHTVSFYRKQRAASVSVTPHDKITRKAGPMIPEEEEEDTPRESIQLEVRKLQVRQPGKSLLPFYSFINDFTSLFQSTSVLSTARKICRNDLCNHNYL